MHPMGKHVFKHLVMLCVCSKVVFYNIQKMTCIIELVPVLDKDMFRKDVNPDTYPIKLLRLQDNLNSTSQLMLTL